MTDKDKANAFLDKVEAGLSAAEGFLADFFMGLEKVVAETRVKVNEVPDKPAAPVDGLFSDDEPDVDKMREELKNRVNHPIIKAALDAATADQIKVLYQRLNGG